MKNKPLARMLKNPLVQYLLRLYQNVGEDYIGLLAAGVAFYFFMAAFPAMAALISLYGLFSDPVFIPEQLGHLQNFLPPESPQNSRGSGVFYRFVRTARRSGLALRSVCC